ncbi:hypothetical protein HYH02_012071 [Chlamydomonas schloesseri]|uniref:Iron-sulfur cluster biosynthesis family protein n=1 Tax=Chlamydomonas schloesseri TaxID=2026947 RepID=A0A835TB14_9CHLO|nr:hypothetical protein HYH02_012071 [Chlamydomonas schloesseri]|eukprot:KAG2434871.1 hypothetical protein HYH02_012071 [Chlamydomonas schloesseri]
MQLSRAGPLAGPACAGHSRQVASPRSRASPAGALRPAPAVAALPRGLCGSGVGQSLLRLRQPQQAPAAPVPPQQPLAPGQRRGGDRAGRGAGSAVLCSASTGREADSDWAPNPMELVKREAGLQSNRLDPDLRERVEAAIERLGGRVTVGDVAARAGVKLAQADEALKALAYDTAAALQVSAAGDLVYAFAPDFRGRLRNRSFVVGTLLPLGRRLGGALSYLSRVAFGTALIASVVVVWLAVMALLRGRGDDRDDRGGGGYRGGYGGGGYYSGRMFMDVTDLFLYWDPYYYQTTARRVASGEQLSFVESIFSFVFGDGDPNADFEERRWQRLGEMIRAKGGVVTAEEMAPYLDPPEPADPPTGRYGSSSGSGTDPYIPYPDENFVLPALIKFGGEPYVDEAGHILYRFPALQLTGVKNKRPANRFSPQAAFDVPMERDWGFTAASGGQVAGTVFLGLLNLVGVAFLSGLMADPRSAYLLAAQGLGFVPGLVGPLQLYAAAFFAIPALRWFLNASRNRKIDARNAARAAAAGLLNGPAAAAGWVANKLAAARQMGERVFGSSGAASSSSSNLVDRPFDRQLPPPRLGPRLVADDEVVFDSGREAEPQLLERDMDDWDSRLGRRGGGGAAGGGGGGRPGGGGGGGSGNGGVARGGRFRR